MLYITANNHKPLPVSRAHHIFDSVFYTDHVRLGYEEDIKDFLEEWSCEAYT